MQTHINSIPLVSSIIVGMDVRKEIIAFYACDASVGVKSGERELLYDLPKANKYFQKDQYHFGKLHCYCKVSSWGFGLQRVLNAHGILCEMIASSTIPRRSGDHIKTDRQDARKLGTLNAARLPMPVCIPDEK